MPSSAQCPLGRRVRARALPPLQPGLSSCSVSAQPHPTGTAGAPGPPGGLEGLPALSLPPAGLWARMALSGRLQPGLLTWALGDPFPGACLPPQPLFSWIVLWAVQTCVLGASGHGQGESQSAWLSLPATDWRGQGLPVSPTACRFLTFVGLGSPRSQATALGLRPSRMPCLTAARTRPYPRAALWSIPAATETPGGGGGDHLESPLGSAVWALSALRAPRPAR